MLQPDKLYTFIMDRKTGRPACVIVQALYGGDREPCHAFEKWETSPGTDFVRITATGAEILDFAAKTR
jgi:hypothetical protein